MEDVREAADATASGRINAALCIPAAPPTRAPLPTANGTFPFRADRGRSSDFRASYRMPLPKPSNRLSAMASFVPSYRCGAVPDS